MPAISRDAWGSKQVGVPKLTMGLFWLNPDVYLALDSLMTDYLESKNIPINPHRVESLADYTAIVDQVRQVFGTDHPQISRDAYLYANQVPASADELDAGLMALLQRMAEQNKISVAQVSVPRPQRTGDAGENEITNRLTTMPLLRDVLMSTPLSLDELRKVSARLWVFSNGQDAMRRNAFSNQGPRKTPLPPCSMTPPALRKWRASTRSLRQPRNTGTRIPRGGMPPARRSSRAC